MLGEIDRSHFKIWITVEDESPDFETFAKVRGELETMGLHHQCIGIAMDADQWANFRRNVSRFEMRFIFADANQSTIIGFPVKIIPRN